MFKKTTNLCGNRNTVKTLIIVLLLCTVCFFVTLFSSYKIMERGEKSSNTAIEAIAPETTREKTTEHYADTTSVSTATNNTSAETTQSVQSTQAVRENVTESVGNVKSSLVFNRSEKRIELGNNINKKCAPASLTKLLTALVALNYVDENTVFQVGSELQLLNPGSSLCLIQAGNRLKLKDLLSGMLMSSGNDAAYTIAVNVAKSINPNISSDSEAVSFFADRMNSYCKSIGMNNSHFITPDGWDDYKQYSTAYDLLLLTLAAMENRTIAEIVKCESKYVVFESGENITWHNTNKLLSQESQYYDKNCTGIKTGTTSEAGYNLISSFETGDGYIIIVLGANSNETRYESTKELLSMCCQKIQ